MYFDMNVYFIYAVIMHLSLRQMILLPLLFPLCATLIKYSLIRCAFNSETFVSSLTNYYCRLCQESLSLYPIRLFLTCKGTLCLLCHSDADVSLTLTFDATLLHIVLCAYLKSYSWLPFL